MAAITPEKTWEVFKSIIYTVGGAYPSECQYQWLELKNGLLSGTVPWIIKGSSNSVAGAMDNVDRWLAVANIIGVGAAPTAHSWIVFEIPELHATDNVQVCIDLVGSTNHYMASIYVSPAAGFTGGSNTNRPTATDESTAVSTGAILNITDSTTSRQVYVCKSTDGHCTRVFMGVGTTEATVMMFDRIKSPHPDIARPWYVAAKQLPVSWSTVFGGDFFHSRIDALATTVVPLRGTTYVMDTTNAARDGAYGYGSDFMEFNQAYPIGLFWPKVAPPVDHIQAGMMYDFWLLGTNGQAWDYLKGVGGAWRVIRVGDGFAQPGDGTTVWWRI